jgi:hypothetical protein
MLMKRKPQKLGSFYAGYNRQAVPLQKQNRNFLFSPKEKVAIKVAFVRIMGLQVKKDKRVLKLWR